MSTPPEEGLTPILLSRTEAARLLGIGRTTLDRLVAEGAITTVRIGRRALVHRAEVERFAAALMSVRATPLRLLSGRR